MTLMRNAHLKEKRTGGQEDQKTRGKEVNNTRGGGSNVLKFRVPK